MTGRNETDMSASAVGCDLGKAGCGLCGAVELKPFVCYDGFEVARCTLLEEVGIARGQRLLDVGCGHDRLLDLARERGLETIGLEFDPVAACCGHRVEVGLAEEGPWSFAGDVDVVTFWDLLEHLEAPGRALSWVFRALAPHGTLVVATPFVGSAWDRGGVIALRASRGRLPQLLRMCWSREHLCRFDPAGLARILQDLGLARALDLRNKILVTARTGPA